MEKQIIPPDDYRTLAAVIEQQAKQMPEKTAYTFIVPEQKIIRKLSYGAIDQKAKAVARQILAFHPPGSRIPLLFPSGLEFLYALFGCFYAGCCAVPLFPPLPGQPLDRIKSVLEDVASSLILTETNGEAYFKDLLTQNGITGLTFLNIDEIDSVPPSAWTPPRITEMTVALLQYTSGSTSAPKGVIVTHNNLIDNLKRMQTHFAINKNSVLLSWLPLYHDMGLIGKILANLYCGSTCVFMAPNSFLMNPFIWLKTLSDYNATHSGGPNFAYELCINKIDSDQLPDLDLSRWEVASNGAEPIKASTLRRFHEKFSACGFRYDAFLPSYGLAEATLFVSGTPKTAPPRIITVDKADFENNKLAETSPDQGIELVSNGKISTGVTAIIVDPQTNTALPEDRIGEIWVLGRSKTHGYWQKDEATDRHYYAFTDKGEGPFLKTGDLGVMHDGELYITGRLKDLIIVRGRNLYPQDIERLAEKFDPAIRTGCCAAFALVLNGTTKVVLVMEIKPSFYPCLNADKIYDRLRQYVSDHFEISLHAIVLIKSKTIPKTTSGKIKRQACQQAFLENRLDVIDQSVLAHPSQGRVDPKEESIVLNQLQGIKNPAVRLPLLKLYLQEEIAKIMAIPPYQVYLKKPVGALGLDSLMIIQLQNEISRDLGVPIGMRELFDAGSIDAIATCLNRKFTSKTRRKSPPKALSTRNPLKIPLSKGQKGLWFIHSREPNSPRYNMPFVFKIKGNLDIDRMRQAFDLIGERHPILLAKIRSDQDHPYLAVDRTSPLEIEHQLHANTASAEWMPHLIDLAKEPFDLTKDRLLRIALFSFADKEHFLFLNGHHIIFDGTSMMLLLSELMENDACLAKGIQPQPRPIEASYADYVAFQEDLLADEDGQRHLNYWRENLSGELSVLNLPVQRSCPPEKTDPYGMYCCDMDTHQIEKLKRLAKNNNITLYSLLLTGFFILLNRLAHQHDLIVGMPVQGRSKPEFEGLIGYFANIVPIRIHLTAAIVFKDLAQEVFATVLAAIEHGDVPFPEIAQMIEPSGPNDLMHLIQAAFAYHKWMVPENGQPSDLNGDTGYFTPWEPLLEISQAGVFPFTLEIVEMSDKVKLFLKYNEKMFDHAFIARVSDYYQNILSAALEAYNRPISSIQMLPPCEYNRLVFDLNQTMRPYPKETIKTLFENQAARTPAHPAIVDGDRSLTYQELNDHANVLAMALSQNGVLPGDRVCVLLNRSIELVASLIAVLKAGGTYIPIDPDYPENRIHFILDDSQAALILAAPETAKRINTPQKTMRITPLALTPNPLPNPELCLSNEYPVYTIYTSGSTGTPKGVMVPHKGLANLCSWHQRIFDINAKDRATMLASPSFDASAWELWPYLLCGASVHIPDKRLLASPSDFYQWLAQKKITLSFLPTPLAEALFTYDCPDPIALKTMLIGGDKLTHFPPSNLPFRVVNNYGPTENAVVTTSTVLNKTPNQAWPPIGTPIDNHRIYVLSPGLQPVPVGVTGELYVGGIGLASGYLNRPDLDQEKFIKDPFCATQNERLYKTGDLVRYLPDGNLEFMGRSDHQVKIRGHRMELGEIENALNKHPQIADTIVGVFQSSSGEKQLCAHIQLKNKVLHPEKKILTSIKEHIRSLLPAYMVPVHFILMNRFPLTPNQKIDRKALPSPEVSSNLNEASSIEFMNTTQRELLHIWRSLLKVAQIELDESFFDLGGHSLLAVRMINAINSVLGTNLSVSAIFEYPTIDQMARHIDQTKRQSSPFTPLIKIKTQGRKAPIFFNWGMHLTQVATICSIMGHEGRYPLMIATTIYSMDLSQVHTPEYIILK